MGLLIMKQAKYKKAATEKVYHKASANPRGGQNNTVKHQNNTSASLLSRSIKECLFILTLALAVFLTLTLCSYHYSDPSWTHSGSTTEIRNLGGLAGAWTADILLYVFGYVSYAIPALLMYSISFRLFRKKDHLDAQIVNWLIWIRLLGVVMIFIAASALLSLFVSTHVNLPYTSGGLLGDFVGFGLQSVFNLTGSSIIFAGLLFAGFSLCLDVSWFMILERLGGWVLFVINTVHQQLSRLFAKKQVLNDTSDISIRQDHCESKNLKHIEKLNVALLPSRNTDKKELPIITAKSPSPASSQPLAEIKVRAGMPSLDLLDEAQAIEAVQYSEKELQDMSRLVELKLLDFGIEVKVVAALPGPVVTRYELQLSPGMKVSKINGLSKDLARSLSVVSVRIVEVIPGKTVIGLELPNEKREIVRLKEVLSSQQYQSAKSPLTMGVGKDISGNAVSVDLAKMPHLLVAGTTGSGKSVGLNAMLLSLLYKATPNELRLIMIDPKMLELSVYEGIPHLLAPVVTDMKEAASALRWSVAEMERRYKLMAAVGVRNLAGFNQKVSEAKAAGSPLKDPLWQADSGVEQLSLETMPYIVILADEFADMIMVVGKKVEELIARLAQKARAAGIHLILATQRPSVDVITGLIKANIPTRMAFQVSSRIDSRTILDQAGAEQLLGHGDMLYLPPGTAVSTRVHGAFVDDHEVHKVVADWKTRSAPNYLEEVLSGAKTGIAGLDDDSSDDASGNGEQDPLYDQAVQFVLESNRASISGVQRKLKVGYNRAARLIETMEESGVVSSPNQNGLREVLVKSQ